MELGGGYGGMEEKQGPVSTQQYRYLLVTASVVAGTVLVHAVSYSLSIYGGIGHEWQVWGASLGYFVIVLSVIWLGVRLGFGDAAPSRDIPLLDAALRHLPFLLAIALVGVACHVIAKAYLFDPEVVDCIADFRTAWLGSAGRELPLAIERASMLGHLLSGFGFAGAFIASYGLVARRGRPSVVTIGFVVALLCVTTYAIMILSRSAMLTLAILVFLGAATGLATTADRLRTATVRMAVVLSLTGVLALGFAFQVFNSKLYCTTGVEHTESRPRDATDSRPRDGGSVESSRVRGYMHGFLDELPMKRRESGARLLAYLRHDVGEICPVCQPVFLYLNHGLWNYERIMDTSRRGSPEVLEFLYYWLHRLGVSVEWGKQTRVYGNGGATLMGAAYHDYGWFGLLGVAVLHGALAVLFIQLMVRRGLAGVFGVTGYAANGITLGMSLIFVAPETVAFPFVAFGLFLSLLIVWLAESRASGAGAQHA